MIDPGNFSPVVEAMSNVEAVLITHEHADHLDTGPVLEVLSAQPSIELYAPPSVAAAVRQAATDAGIEPGRIHEVEVGQEFSVAGMNISTHGGVHALIHSSLPRVANIGYFINENLYHPGDSYEVPAGITVKTLLVPLHAPWANIGQTVDFVAALNAAHNYPIHDGLLNERGLAMFDGHLTRVCTAAGHSYARLDAEPVVLEA